MSAPPRLAVSWLERRLHPDERQELIGDLTEQFHLRVARDGARRARRWFWREAMALSWGFDLHRRDVMSQTHERTRGKWTLIGRGRKTRSGRAARVAVVCPRWAWGTRCRRLQLQR